MPKNFESSMMNRDHAVWPIWPLYALYGLGAITSYWFFGVGMPEWVVFLEQVFFVLLVFAVHTKQSRMAAMAALLFSLRDLAVYGTYMFGFEVFAGAVVGAGNLSHFQFIQAVLAMPFIYKIMVGSFAFHRARNSKTNLRNVIIVTLVTFVWVFCILAFYFVFLVDIADYKTDASQRQIFDNIASTLLTLLIIAGSLRKLPGLEHFPTLRPEVEGTERGETGSYSTLDLILLYVGGAGGFILGAGGAMALAVLFPAASAVMLAVVPILIMALGVMAYWSRCRAKS